MSKEPPLVPLTEATLPRATGICTDDMAPAPVSRSLFGTAAYAEGVLHRHYHI